MEPGIFVLHLTQPSVSPSTMDRKRRKLDSGKYIPAEPPEASGRDIAGSSSVPCSEQLPPSEPQVAAVEMSDPADGATPLILVAEPQALTWARHMVHFLQTGELPEDPEEAERVARRSSMYQFVDDTLYRRRPNGVKLKCICREVGKELLADTSRHVLLSPWIKNPGRQSLPVGFLLAHGPPRCNRACRQM
jgi:hypothetical protein